LAKVNDALDGGDETRAMRILCSAHEDLPWRHSFGSSATTYVRLAELIHKRHAEVFLPPGNIEDLVPYIWWSRLGPWQDGQDRPARVKRAQEIGAPDAVDSTHVYRRAPPAPFLIRVDLDLDGTAELTFDGQSVDTHGGAVAVDRADDGRREQWLVAPAGVDPRQRSAIFFYRDGDYYILLVDVDGDGEGEYQSAGCVPRNED
jgi:hypothetical protein